MAIPQIYGYSGKILRVDLTKGEVKSESLPESTLRKYIGGSGLGTKYIYDEVPPELEWSSPENRIFLGTGPLGGTTIGGSGTICGVTKGALTNGVAMSQCNGFFGAYLGFSGFDGILLHGSAPKWVYLYIHDGTAEIKDAAHLVGKDTFETEDVIKKELGKKERETSVLDIGPAGENMVRFACIAADKGHIMAHNGFGAVMGSKKLKAIAVDRGSYTVPIKDKEALSQLAKEIREYALGEGNYKKFSEWGTLFSYSLLHQIGWLPVKNYTTGIHVIEQDKLKEYEAENIRSKFKGEKPRPCWGCRYHHCGWMEIPEGKNAGRIVEEPEYEGMSAWSSQVGISDVSTTFALSDLVDRLGFDTNESGWVIGWVIECYEKGILTKENTDGLEMTWGNAETIEIMLNKIARRQGFGDILAEGVKRASEHVGGMAVNMAIYTKKGNTPRGHDHRVIAGWLELFDTIVSSTGTLEGHLSIPYRVLGLEAKYEEYNPMAVTTMEAKIKGATVFEDCLGTCRFNTATNVELLPKAINAATGWDMNLDDAMAVGRRTVNLARIYNLRCGISGELDAPSTRYGSTPIDGPLAGKGIMPHLDEMRHNYYNLMGWDEKGKPLPATLKNLGLEDVVQDLEKI